MAVVAVRRGIAAAAGAVCRGLRRYRLMHCAPTIDSESGNTHSGAHKILTARHRAVHSVTAVRAPRSEQKAACHGIRVPDDTGRRVPYIVPALTAESVRVGADFEARRI